MPEYKLHRGDCLKVLKTLPSNSVDSIVTDPPYGLSKEPDMTEVLKHWLAGDDYRHSGSGFMGKSWDSFVPGPAVWKEALRVLKPGGHLLAFFGSRTYDMGTLAIRLAGFEIRDQIMWVYGSGFPKSQNVSKAMDKAAGAQREVVGMKGVGSGNRRGNGFNHAGGANGIPETTAATEQAMEWDGWGTALKPAHEPICVARKPLDGTVVDNVLAHGTGALNIDGCRIPTDEDLNGGAYAKNGRQSVSNSLRQGGGMNAVGASAGEYVQPAGRWPANLIHDGSDDVVQAFPDAAGQQGPISTSAPSEKTSNVYGRMKRESEVSADSDNAGSVGFKMRPGMRRLDQGSAARFFYCAKASRSERNAGLEGFEGGQLNWSNGAKNPGSFQSIGTNRSAMNNHPTVKPISLCRYLCKLVTPPGGSILDLYTGSGSIGCGAVLEGFSFTGIDLDEDEDGEPLGYLAIAEARISFFGGLPIDDEMVMPRSRSSSGSMQQELGL